VPTTFNVFSLGNTFDIDPTEGNSEAEDAALLAGTTFGSIGSPLYGYVQELSPGSTGSGNAVPDAYAQDNNQPSDTFSINGGADQTFDGLAVYNATLTYSDGTTATISAVLFQDTAGSLYLAPESGANADQTALEAKPITSLTLDSFISAAGSLSNTRQAGNFVEPDGTIQGTTGNDVIGSGYTDGDGDAIDGFDGDDDIVLGGDGDDSIFAGAGNDTLLGGEGANILDGGVGNDIFVADGANDTIVGGDGYDTIDQRTSGTGFNVDTFSGIEAIYASNDGDNWNWVTDEILFQGGTGNDIVNAGSGDDTLFGNDGNDIIYSGDGNDTIGSYAGTDNGDDLFYGDAGNDSIIGGWGNDTVFGGIGNDTLAGHIGVDTLYGGAGSDVFHVTDDHETVYIFGGDAGSNFDLVSFSNYATTLGVSATYSSGDSGTFDYFGTAGTGTFTEIEDFYFTTYSDTFDGSLATSGLKAQGLGGDDTIIGGAGNDTLYGGAGLDAITGGIGNDIIDLDGDTDRDTVVFDDGFGDDIIYQFDMSDYGDGTTVDELDVSDLTNGSGAPVDAWDVTVSDTVGDGSGDAILSFPNGETITLVGVSTTLVDSAPKLYAMGIPCFATGTLIDTPTGERKIENLTIGDLVSTREYGPMPVRWIAATSIGDGQTTLPASLLPVRIKPGPLGNTRALIVSPQHCILLENSAVGREHFVRAKHLAEETNLAAYARGRKRVTYVHLMLDCHASLISNGIASESFYPGPQALKQLSPSNLHTLLELLPALNCVSARDAYGARAHPVMKRKEVRRHVCPT